MKKKSALMLAACLVISSSAYAVQVRGVSSCGEWVKDRSTKNGYAQGQTWIVGYLSGVAVGLNREVLKGTDNESIFLWMDNYCKANPLKMTSEGGAELVRELLNIKD